MTVDAFWEWSVERYSHPATREYLLTLQDSLDLVVLEALFGLWLGSQRCEWQEDVVDRLDAASDSWLRAVVVPLRSTRKEWRSEPTLQTARQHLLALEVQAERHLAELMWDAVMVSGDGVAKVLHQPDRPIADLMRVNLGCIAPFRDGKYVSEREQVVVLIDQAT